MIVHSYLRQIAVEFLWQLVDPARMRKEDIRWVKDNEGVFPQRIVRAELPNGQFETKKTPYQPASDLLVLFDIIPFDNIASEVKEQGIASMWPFDLVINIYGRDADYLSQRIRAKLHDYNVISWLSALKISLKQMPLNSAVLDGFENQTWWIRRKLTLNLNIAQLVNYDNADQPVFLETVTPVIEIVGE